MSCAVATLALTACQPASDGIENFSNRIALAEKPGSRALYEGRFYSTTDERERARDAFAQAMRSPIPAIKAEALRETAKLMRLEQEAYDAQSLELLERAAELGDAQAATLLAEYYLGLGASEKAVDLLLPVYKDYTPAKAMLGTIYAGRHDARGRILLHRAVMEYNGMLAEKNPAAHFPLAVLHADAALPVYNPKLAFHHYREAAKHGAVGAYQPLAEMYRYGVGTQRNAGLAVEQYEKLAEMGSGSSIRHLAEAYQPGGWYRPDAQQSAKWWKRLAEMGVMKGMVNTGRNYATGNGLPHDLTRAKAWFDRAIAQDPAQAYRIAKILHKQGGETAMKLARDYLEAAIVRGDERAGKYFYTHYLQELDTLEQVDRVAAMVTKDPSLASEQLLLALAEKYSSFGKEKLGIEWLNKAADGGSLEAMKQLARQYAVGLSVPQSFKESLKWNLKAASLGDSEAQYHLGLAYARGLGVAKDEEKAVYWLTKASAAGAPGARAVLDTLSNAAASATTGNAPDATPQ